MFPDLLPVLLVVELLLAAGGLAGGLTDFPMLDTYGQQDNTGEKPTVGILYSYIINRHEVHTMGMMID